MPNKPVRFLALCGILGPILFACVVVILGALSPGYQHMSQQMSELGADGAAHAALYNGLGLGALGGLIIAFSLGLHLGIQPARRVWIGPALLATGGLVLITTGVLSCDPGCNNYSTRGVLHEYISIGIFTLAVAPLALAGRFRKDSRWRGYVTFSIAAGVISLLLGLLFGFGPMLGLDGWMGALQRATVGTGLLWMELIAIRLYRLSTSHG